MDAAVANELLVTVVLPCPYTPPPDFGSHEADLQWTKLSPHDEELPIWRWEAARKLARCFPVGCQVRLVRGAGSQYSQRQK